jgi:glycine dehydrogenase
VQAGAASVGANLRIVNETMDEGITRDDLKALLSGAFKLDNVDLSADDSLAHVDAAYAREGDILVHPIFRMLHSETQMLRYLKLLKTRDLALNHSMISLGSCTMKLNATSKMIPVTCPEICDIHPFAPHDQVVGYHEIRANKFWPSCGRVDNVYVDHNLVCTCPPLEAYEDPVDQKLAA